MSRRPGSRVAAVDRPRQKGWWGQPEPDELEPAPAAELPQRRPPPAPAERSRVTIGVSLTPNQIAAMRAVMHLFVEDDLSRGVDPRSTMYCDRCESPRSAPGFVQYGRLTFCNECSTGFEIARARGQSEVAAEYAAAPDRIRSA